MKTKVCKGCGIEFETNNPRKEFHTRICFQRYNRRVHPSYHKKYIGVLYRKCELCGESFNAKNGKHIYCGKCSSKNDRRYLSKKVYFPICKNCQQRFTSRRCNTKHCNWCLGLKKYTSPMKASYKVSFSNCLVCGELLTIPPGRGKKVHKHCHTKWHKNRMKYYNQTKIAKRTKKLYDNRYREVINYKARIRLRKEVSSLSDKYVERYLHKLFPDLEEIPKELIERKRNQLKIHRGVTSLEEKIKDLISN